MVFVRKLKRNGHTYLVEVESYRKGGKVKQRYLRYIGKEVDDKRVLTGSIANAQVTKVSVYGPLLALHSIASELGLAEILGEDAPEMLSMVYAHCTAPSSLTKLVQWFERTDLNHLLSLRNLTEKRLLAAIDAFDTDERRDAVQRALVERLREIYGFGEKGVYYDLTDVYFYGRRCELAARGHNSDGLAHPQVQVGLGITSGEGFPVFVRTYAGNVHDSKTVPDILLAFREQGLTDVTFVWDRGITSGVNTDELTRLGARVLCGVPLTTKLKKLLPTVDTMMSVRNHVALSKSVLYATAQPHTLGTTSGTLILCYNPLLKETTRIERHKRILEAQRAREENRTPIPAALKKFFRTRGLNDEAIGQAARYDGYSLLFTTNKQSTAESVRAYFDKDLVEKAFRTLKGITHIRPVRHWLEQRVRAHVFICYLSYALLSVLSYKLKKAELKMSAPEALNKLQTLYRVHLLDPKSKNTFEKTVAYTKEQEQILRAIQPALLRM